MLRKNGRFYLRCFRRVVVMDNRYFNAVAVNFSATENGNGYGDVTSLPAVMLNIFAYSTSRICQVFLQKLSADRDAWLPKRTRGQSRPFRFIWEQAHCKKRNQLKTWQSVFKTAIYENKLKFSKKSWTRKSHRMTKLDWMSLGNPVHGGVILYGVKRRMLRYKHVSVLGAAFCVTRLCIERQSSNNSDRDEAFDGNCRKSYH